MGYVTQVNVEERYRRSLVAAALLQAQFDRSAYGCKLYCCWCAQDLRANEFWEAMGFSPIAFRTGSRTKGKNGTPRMHVFWQKRIWSGDVETPWWYPSQTGGGELREDRLVFPMPAGVSWRDVLPVVLPAAEDAPPQADAADVAEGEEQAVSPKLRRRRVKRVRVVSKPRGEVNPHGLYFLGETVDVREEYEEWVYYNGQGEEVPAPRKVKPRAAALDPRLTAMARELRGRWAEESKQVGSAPAKHDVRRVEGDAPGRLTAEFAESRKLLARAA